MKLKSNNIIGLMSLTALAFAGLSLPSRAQIIPITLNNPSFESPSVESTGYASGVGSWNTYAPSNTTVGVVGTEYKNSNTPSGIDGNQDVYVPSPSTSAYYGIGLNQDTSFPLLAGDTYSFTLDLGRYAEQTPTSGSAILYLAPSAANSPALATLTVQGTDLTTTFTPYTVSFTVPTGASYIGEDLVVGFEASPNNTTTSTNGYSFAIDNASATFSEAASIPEPSTWAMMLGGLGIVFIVLRRRGVSSV